MISEKVIVMNKFALAVLTRIKSKQAKLLVPAPQQFVTQVSPLVTLDDKWQIGPSKFNMAGIPLRDPDPRKQRMNEPSLLKHTLLDCTINFMAAMEEAGQDHELYILPSPS